MPITKDDVDKVSKEIDQFERIIPGIRFGDDYPQFALAVIGSEEYDALLKSFILTGVLQVVLSDPPKTTPEAHDWIKKQQQESPLRECLLRAFYIGFKLGQQDKKERTCT